MLERGISRDEVLVALRRSVHRKQGPVLVATYLYFHVVFRKEDDGFVVITVMLPR